MTFTRKNGTVILYLVELSVFMFLLNMGLDTVTSGWAWELGLALMGISIILLAVLKNERWDTLIISIFEWGLSFFLYDMESFILVLFAGGIVP